MHPCDATVPLHAPEHTWRRIDAPGGPSANVQEFNSTRHLFHTKEWHAANDASNAARPTKPGSGTGISYHGGTVIAGLAVTMVVGIYWGGTIYSGQAAGTGRPRRTAASTT